MASYLEVAFSGSTSSLPVPFPYLDKSHVFVFLNGVVLAPNEYSWVSGSQIQLPNNPASGTKGLVRRITPTDPLTTFFPGNLDTIDLNVAALQPLYLAEEARDIASNGGGSGGGGNGGDGGGGDYEAPVQVGTEFPANPVEGQLFYKLPEGILYIFQDGQWVRVVPSITEEDIQNGLYSNGLRPIEYLAALPTTGNVEGRVVYNTTDHTLYMYTGGTWKTFGQLYAPDAPSGLAVYDSDPATGNFEGRIIFNRTLSKLRKYSSGAWADVAVNTSIGPNSITTDMLVANAITAGKIAAAAIGTDQLAANAITAAKLAANSVTAAAIQSGVIAADHIAALAITAAKIAAGAVTADKLAANSVTAGKIDAGVITASHIQAETITANNIQANAISVAKATSASSQWPNVNTRTSLLQMLFPCTPGCTRIISFSTQLTDESSNGVANPTTKPVQGKYEVEIGGSVVFTFDSFAAAATTCLHSVAFHDSVPGRSSFVLFEIFATAVPYLSGERTKVGFRTPTLSVFELRR